MAKVEEHEHAIEMLDRDHLRSDAEATDLEAASAKRASNCKYPPCRSRARIAVLSCLGIAIAGIWVLFLLGRPGHSPNLGNIGTELGEDDCQYWSKVETAMEDFAACNVSLLAGDAAHGTMFFVRKGPGAPTLHEKTWIASGTKWITAAIILDLVERGILDLDDSPEKFLPFWSTSEGDDRNAVTLHHLLSFTSGMVLRDEKANRCVGDIGNMTACARQIFELGAKHPPGTALFYSNNHLTVASAIAEEATGQTLQDLLNAMSERVGFTDSPEYGLGGAAGGLRISASDYARFLRSLLQRAPHGFLRTSALRETSFQSHTLNTPHMSDLAPFGLPAWDYSYGHWMGCASGSCVDPSSPTALHSCMGAFGFFPTIQAPLNPGPHQLFSIVLPNVSTLEQARSGDMTEDMMLSYALYLATADAVQQAMSSISAGSTRGMQPAGEPRVCTIVQDQCR